MRWLGWSAGACLCAGLALVLWTGSWGSGLASAALVALLCVWADLRDRVPEQHGPEE
jgi:hypothetical protein